MIRLSVRERALAALVDDASLFPPAQRGMADAIATHRAQRASAYGAYQGRFVVASARLPELVAAGPVDDLDASVILPAAERALGPAVGAGLAIVHEARERGGFRVDAFECRLPGAVSADDLATACRAIVSFAHGAETLVSFEIPFASGFVAPVDAVLAELSLARAAFASEGLAVSAKLRCGGLTLDAIPSVSDAANFICAAHTHRVPFKATAGLHHPIRTERAENGLPMHGFLNVLFAALAHDAGALDGDGVAAVLAETNARAFALDDERFAWNGVTLDTAAVERGRAHAFLSYGSCSFAEPIADLRHMGILA
jgi:hypothetical protein